MCDKAKLIDIGHHAVWRRNGTTPFFFSAGMAIDADGAPNAYRPDNKGLDDLANAGRPGKWWALVTGDGTAKGSPIVQGPHDPSPGAYVSMTSLENLTKDRKNPARYVDSTKIPYIVLPGALAKAGGAHLGDFAAVWNAKNRRLAYAIYADVGPPGKLGESSIALAKALGVPANPRAGGVDRGISYIVFPGSGNRKPRSRAEIQAHGEQSLTDWGGVDLLRGCLAGR